MNKNLVGLLQSFSKNEWGDFEDFISSPYYVKSRDYGELFVLIKKLFAKDKSMLDYSVDDIQQLLKGKFSKQTIHNRIYELNKLAEKFLIVKNQEKNPIENFACLFDELVERSLFSSYNISHKNNKDKIQPVEVNDFIPYCRIIQAEGFYQRHNSNFPETIIQFSKQADYISAYFLDKLVYYYTEYFLFDSINIPYNADNFKVLFNSIDLDKIAVKYSNSGDVIFKPFLMRYYILKALQNTKDEKLADGVHVYFEKNRSSFTVNVKTDYFQKMQAYYNFLINSGDESAFKKVHELHKERLEDGETINFSMMSYPATEFRDFVIVGLNADDFKWVEDFISKHSGKLHTTIRKEEITLAKVRLNIARKDLLMAVQLLKKQKNSKSHVHNIDSYVYKIMLYFELTMFDKMDLEIDNLTHYLNKSGLVEIQLKNTKIFVDNIQRLMRIIKKTSKESMSEFTEHINTSPESVSIKKWFLKVTNNLE
jgi:hypothetical protein